MKNIYRLLFCSILLFQCGKTVFAQRLPNKQTIHVSLPNAVKIDGKATEWDNVFQAYNHNTNIFYTIANNKDNIYLIVQAKDQFVIKKIIGGGITFTINKNNKRSDTSNLAITYPLLNAPTQSQIASMLTERKEYLNNVIKSDSILKGVNDRLFLQAKEIKVKGFANINDPVLSIYNVEHIKAKIQIDNTGALIYECIFPAKFLPKIEDTDQLIYNIMINGVNSIIRTTVGKNPYGVVSVIGTPIGLMGTPANLEAMSYPTDFWGEYLVK